MRMEIKGLMESGKMKWKSVEEARLWSAEVNHNKYK